MALLLNQRELLSVLKRETLANIRILHIICPLPDDLSRQIREGGWDKPSHTMFVAMTRYLVNIISPNNSLPWPLYDSAGERAYKAELSRLLTQYKNTGLVAPVLSSYFVNPGSFKVIKMVYQLTVLATNNILQQKVRTPFQKSLLKDISTKYNAKNDEFHQLVDNMTKVFSDRVTNHQHYRCEVEKMAEILRNQIIDNEKECSKKIDAICECVDTFLSNKDLSKDVIDVFEDIKNVEMPVSVFDDYLMEIDNDLDEIEAIWDEKVTKNLLETSRHCFDVTTALIGRYTGEVDKKSYMIEYDPTEDRICTSSLEAVCNTQQTYILRNIIRDDRLSYPNLIRGYVVALCHIFKGTNFSQDSFSVNNYLVMSQKNIREILNDMKTLTCNFNELEVKFKSHINTSKHSIEDRSQDDELITIPPLPDLTICDEVQQSILDPCTPLNITRKQYNILRKGSLANSTRLKQPKSLLTPFHTTTQNDFLKSVISGHVSSYDRNPNQTTSFMPPSINKNITIAGNSTTFTKQQIMKLLSTKKTSVTKQKLNKNKDVDSKIRVDLFNTYHSNLVRSHSSPNLFENREKKSRVTLLSPMQENLSSLLEVSGIVALDNASKNSTPLQPLNLDASDNSLSSIPIIKVNSFESNVISKFNKLNLDAINLEVNGCTEQKSTISGPNSAISTPKDSQPVRKTSSIERIINRYKKVRQTAIAAPKHNNIAEELEKENFAEVDGDWPMYNIPDDIKCKQRESLGTALGVDNTFLDQFDLID